MRRASYSLLSQLSSPRNKINLYRILSRAISFIPNHENPLPSQHSHFKYCSKTSLLPNRKINHFQKTPSRNLDTLVENSPHLSSRQTKVKEKSYIEEEFESASTTEGIMMTAFKAIESVFDENDPKLGLVWLKVALLLEKEGKEPEKTLEFAVRALRILDKAEKGSIHVAMTLRIMGSACFNLARFNDSLGYLNRANWLLGKLEESAGGVNAKDIRPILHAVQLGLAKAKSAMDQSEEALVNHIKCLEIKEMTFDPESREIGVANRVLAEAYVAALKFKEALPHCLKALQIHKAQLGDDAVEVAHDRSLLWIVYTGLKEDQKALKHKQLCQEIFQKWGCDCDLLRAEIDAANVQISLGKFDEAINALEGVVHQTDEESKTRAMAFIAMANALIPQDRFSDSEWCLGLACEILDKKETETPKEVAVAYMEIAMLYEKMTEFESAVALLNRTLCILEKLPQEKSSKGRASAGLGWLLILTRKAQQAIPCLENAAELLKESFGSKHHRVGSLYCILGDAYQELVKPKQAAQMYATAKEIMDVSLGPYHAGAIVACQNLARAYSSMGIDTLAIVLQQDARDAWLNHDHSADQKLPGFLSN